VTGALTWARLSFAQQRWEILILTFGVVVAIGLMLWMTLQLLDISAAYPECDFFLNEDQVALPADCDQASSGVRLASGERLSMGEFYGDGNEAVQGPDGQLYANAADAEGERNPIGQEYILVIPGDRYLEIMARGSLVTAGAGALLMVGAAMVTSRRRPT